MSAIEQSFNFEGWGVRAVMIDGEAWFVARDIASALGYANISDALTRHCKGVVKHYPLQTAGGSQEIRVISEADVLRLIVSSKLPAAQQFERWVFETVLPEIRKTGSYNAAPAMPDLSTPEGVLALAQTLTKTAEELVAAKNEVAELAPLASQARTFNKAKGNIGRQKFARSIVNWAVDNGYVVNVNQVYEFMGGRKLDLFVHGAGRSDHGHASAAGLRRGYSVTDRGESRINGHPYEQGKLTPAGYEYAWSRIENYVREHGHLELPKKGIAA